MCIRDRVSTQSTGAASTAQTATMLLILCVVLGAAVAQAAKVVIESVKEERFALESFCLPGGMPSSHASCVTTLLCLVIHLDGIGSTSTAIVFTLWGYMLYDAVVTRWQLGLHARALNAAANTRDIEMSAEGDNLSLMDESLSEVAQHGSLKDRLGHTRVEVAAGVVVGVLWSLALIAGGVSNAVLNTKQLTDSVIGSHTRH
eukprot:TRINITY_DN20083_c0_g1_i1.p1 TRINITY_DN20083_c0_g1~~TRINITY_DN20083_c0_g1_i1.p1  ORF type:complete len:202 (+),score=44.52 TRINITY_DN20083_c0_g1_i1:108-713(+)